jgi:hypothetical protein
MITVQGVTCQRVFWPYGEMSSTTIRPLTTNNPKAIPARSPRSPSAQKATARPVPLSM